MKSSYSNHILACCFNLILLIGSLSTSFVFAQNTDSLRAKYNKTDIYKESMDKTRTSYVYPDSIVLPPLHFHRCVCDHGEAGEKF